MAKEKKPIKILRGKSPDTPTEENVLSMLMDMMENDKIDFELRKDIARVVGRAVMRENK